MASKKLSSDTSLANSYKLSRGVASVARPSAPTIGTATDGGSGNMSVTFTASTLGPTASSFTLTSSSGVTGSGASSPLTLQEAAVGTYTYSVSGVNANGTGPSSAASNSVNVASVFAPSGAYDSIATVTVGAGGAASAEFTSIPATYTHLQIRGIPKAVGTANIAVNGLVQINSDTGSNYSRHLLDGNGSVATATGSASQSSIVFCPIPDSNISGSGSMFAGFVMDILDYANTNKYKTVRTLSGYDLNNATYGALRFYTGLWMNTNAITSIKFYADGVNLAQYSHFALYGIKG